MTRHAWTCALAAIALTFPALAGCHFETTVGSDLTDSGAATDGGGTTRKDAGCPAAEACNMPMIPVGCSITAGSCVDGQYVCPEVVCPDSGTTAIDAGSCTPSPCAEPAIPAASGCTLGSAACVDGNYVCPPIICPDAGTGGSDASAAGAACKSAGGTCTATGSVSCTTQAPDADQDCNPDRNPGGSFCCLDATPVDAGACVNVDLSAYDLSCTASSDCVIIQSGQVCDGDCACGDSAVSSKDQSQYDQAISSLKLGECGCPMETAQCIGGKCVWCGFENGCTTTATTFACGTGGLTCDPTTEYCHIVEGGVAPIDGGTGVYPTCQSYPTDCAADTGDAATMCACLAKDTSGMCTYDSTGTDFTITIEAP